MSLCMRRVSVHVNRAHPFRFSSRETGYQQKPDSLLEPADVQFAACQDKLQMRDSSTRLRTGNSESLAVVQPNPALGFSLFDAGRLYARGFRKRSRAIDLMACRALVTLAQNEGVT
jgi:hypothetical protein